MKKGKARKLARMRRQYQEEAPERRRQLQERVQKAAQERAAKAEQLAREKATQPLEGEILPPERKGPGSSPHFAPRADASDISEDRDDEVRVGVTVHIEGFPMTASLSLAMALEGMFIAEDDPMPNFKLVEHE